MNEELNSFTDLFAADANLQPLMDAIEQIMAIPEEQLTDENIEVINGMVRGAFTDRITNDTINELIENFETEGYTRAEARANMDAAKQAISEAIDELKPSAHKRSILNGIFDIFYNIFDAALERYHSYNIDLPIKLEETAQAPTYAHETDACADIYASKDMTIPAHSLSNKVPTGLRIALPEGWVAKIAPRSSIGMNTGLRLSNSIGIIDADYRGEIGVLYDNFSDSDYEIKAGDRIAQMWIERVARFRPVKVVDLPETERGSGGFGSTGK